MVAFILRYFINTLKTQISQRAPRSSRETRKAQKVNEFRIIYFHNGSFYICM